MYNTYIIIAAREYPKHSLQTAYERLIYILILHLPLSLPCLPTLKSSSNLIK